VNGVISGWTEALQLMTVGSKWKLYIPSELAYGDRQMGPSIAPGSTLIFEVEVLAIEK
jgi:FKBP-type peptidyl-prolyl cis-trans isomerase FklB